MARHVFEQLVLPLPDPPIIKREQHQQIRTAIEELQKHTITGARCDDGSLFIHVVEGELQFENGLPPAMVAELEDVDMTELTSNSIIQFDGTSWKKVECEQRTIVVDVRYDSTLKQIQKKTYTVLLIPVAGQEPSDWTMIEGGQAEECET